eukprot:TRINITY_DN29101_c0_g1_i1.p1 TRINITY_DN29101_c0_g1~~TRINITY_DN29101_c0_g1_i1.p1  ORF type:complete len:206 (-),score=32.21 TRINITY_DN29101_c0_g1_i1:73-690(-)
MSDCYPVCGYRRKMYLVVGNSTAMVCLFVLGMEAAAGRCNVITIALCLFGCTMGLIMGDTMADALAVEYEKRCHGATSTGEAQKWCYGTRFGAEIVGASCGALFYNHHDWGWGLPFEVIPWVCAGVIFCGLIFLTRVVEVPYDGEIPSPGSQMSSMFDVMKLQAAWKPMLYIFSYNMFQLSLIHISEPTRLLSISYAVFCLKKKK